MSESYTCPEGCDAELEYCPTFRIYDCPSCGAGFIEKNLAQ